MFSAEMLNRALYLSSRPMYGLPTTCDAFPSIDKMSVSIAGHGEYFQSTWGSNLAYIAVFGLGGNVLLPVELQRLGSL